MGVRNLTNLNSFCPLYSLSAAYIMFTKFNFNRDSKSETFFAEALADARKLHPDLQMYMQAVTQAECQTVENGREKYKEILKSKVCASITYYYNASIC